MKRATKKDKRRILLLFIILVPLLVLFVSNVWKYSTQIVNNVQSKKELDEVYKEKLSEEEKLQSEIIKLQDPEYIARYAREKYLYSKDGEIIIKID
jgi:cell division protein DivIC